MVDNDHVINKQYRRQLLHRDRIIELSIIRKRRKTLAIHVFPGSKPVELRVPLNCPWSQIESFLDSRKDWIIESLDEFSRNPMEPETTWQAGELHFFLGDAYPLQLMEGRGNVHIRHGLLKLRCTRPNDAVLVRKQLEHFYKLQSLPVFSERLSICTDRFPVAVSPAGLRVRKMRARWGSCASNGEICLNTLLVQQSIAVIDFVITHELCHLKHFGHNKAFYHLLDRAMPDWREVEKTLGRNGSAPQQLRLF